jgi:pimeloyl-ACP methyl ester carboxylesterase
MQSFQMTLSDGKVVSGRCNLPTSASTTAVNAIPLIVALHGGSYTARYFDVDANHTAAIASNGLGVPFIAIDRPSYNDTTPVSIPDGSSYVEESGLWFHRYVLPALWTKYGEPSGCNCVVLHAHSMGAMAAVIVAKLYASDADSRYPLGGISMSGFGSQPGQAPNLPPQDPDATTVLFPIEVKDTLMLQKGHADPSVYKYTAELNHPFHNVEMASAVSVWFPRWRELAASVLVPVMIAFAGDDLMWNTTEAHLQEVAGAFTHSERVDGSIVKGAPHNIEMSYWAKGWYARCFGFALECAALLAQKKSL